MGNIKTIAIVGAASKIGSAIARSLRGKYTLLLMSLDHSKVTELTKELSSPGSEVYALSCAKDAAWEADIIIIATPYAEDAKVAAKIKDVAVGKIVISVSNPLDDSRNNPGISEDSSAAEELQKLLPHSKVVKTFNTSFAADFMTTVRDGRMVDAFIAGNNSDAVDSVAKMVASAGFTPVVVGDLTMSRTLERMQLTLRKMALRNNLPPFGNMFPVSSAGA